MKSKSANERNREIRRKIESRGSSKKKSMSKGKRITIVSSFLLVIMLWISYAIYQHVEKYKPINVVSFEIGDGLDSNRSNLISGNSRVKLTKDGLYMDWGFGYGYHYEYHSATSTLQYFKNKYGARNERNLILKLQGLYKDNLLYYRNGTVNGEYLYVCDLNTNIEKVIDKLDPFISDDFLCNEMGILYRKIETLPQSEERVSSLYFYRFDTGQPELIVTDFQDFCINEEYIVYSSFNKKQKYKDIDDIYIYTMDIYSVDLNTQNVQKVKSDLPAGTVLLTDKNIIYSSGEIGSIDPPDKELFQIDLKNNTERMIYLLTDCEGIDARYNEYIFVMSDTDTELQVKKINMNTGTCETFKLTSKEHPTQYTYGSISVFNPDWVYIFNASEFFRISLDEKNEKQVILNLDS